MPCLTDEQTEQIYQDLLSEWSDMCQDIEDQFYPSEVAACQTVKYQAASMDPDLAKKDMLETINNIRKQVRLRAEKYSFVTMPVPEAHNIYTRYYQLPPPLPARLKIDFTNDQFVIELEFGYLMIPKNSCVISFDSDGG